VTVLVAAAIFILLYSPSAVELPPCSACAQKPELGDQVIPTVKIGELLSARTEYEGRLVRVTAYFHNDACYWSIFDGDSRDSANWLAAAYAPDVSACKGAQRNLNALAGIDSWYDGTAEVVVVGRLGTLENPDSCWRGKHGFEINCLEQAGPRRGDFYGPWLLRRLFRRGR
jgi:hypothetical protein